MQDALLRKPHWLRHRFTTDTAFGTVRQLIEKQGLHTVCRSAMCPNLQECWSSGTATFLLLGDRCTRGCRFCAIEGTASPAPPDPDEPRSITEAVSTMQLRYVVLTSVTRDDLPDGGASHWVTLLRTLRRALPELSVECLIPDFAGNTAAIDLLMAEKPDVLNHNVETVSRLYEEARPEASYQGSLDLLRRAAERFGLTTKSGLMVGMGEAMDEVLETLHDLAAHDCSMVTIGQYLQPTRRHLPVARYVHPKEFALLRDEALKLGFRDVQSGPFVRSSYHAADSGTPSLPTTP